MNKEGLEESLAETLRESGIRGRVLGEYHPSTISGCALKATLDAMVDKETGLNKWLFQGSAVHYYMQNHPSPEGYDGIITEALHDAGYHTLDTEYEVGTRHRISDNVVITGTCDIITADQDDNRTIFDLKYSSVKPSRNKDRLMKYLTQVNCYSNMFGADKHGLILIDNREKESIPDNGITVIGGEPQEDNWEIQKEKAKSIDKVLRDAGYEGGERWSKEMLESADVEFWEEIMDVINSDHCPSYEKECRYCDHEDYCPVVNGKTGGGLTSFKGGT